MDKLSNNDVQYLFEFKDNETKNEIIFPQNPFKNGKKGEEYLYAFKIPNTIICFSIKGFEDFGLKIEYYEDKTYKICGIPIVAGEAEIEISIKYENSLKEIKKENHQFKIIFNPDPRDLWKDIPTDQNIEYYKKDNECKLIDTNLITDCNNSEDNKIMIAASQRGRSHAHVGKPRDDHFKIAFFSETKWYFIALADGAGSAPLSRKGSEIACESVYKYIKDNINTLEESIKNTEKDLNEEDKKNIANSAYLLLSKAAWNAKDDINKEAIKTEKQVRDFSTTLLFLICKKFSFGWFFATFNVGDGAIAILSENDDNNEPISPLINELDEGEYSGQTLFLTMQQVFIKDKLPSRIKFRILKNFKSAILMTDGISDAKFETLENLHSPYKWSNLWDELYATVQLNELNKETPQKLLDWLLFWSPGNHDDRTIAILY